MSDEDHKDDLIINQCYTEFSIGQIVMFNIKSKNYFHNLIHNKPSNKEIIL